MRGRDFQTYLERDGWRCIHCSAGGDTLIPGHRQGRGIGGSKAREVPSNVVVMCANYNGLIESNASAADEARAYGWKLAPWQDPKEIPVYDPFMRTWYLLDDDFNRTPTTPPEGGYLAKG